MTLRDEAMVLVSLLPNAGKYSEKLAALLAVIAQSESAIASLKLQEKVTSEATASKLEASTALLQALTAQSDELETKNATARAKIDSDSADLARRETELKAASAAHADEVARALQEHASRESDLKQRQSVLDADFHRRLEDLRGVENKLRDRHAGLRDLVTETRARLAAAS